MRSLRMGWLVLGLAGMLSACGGGSSGAPLFTVGGTVSGLPAGAQLTLTDNGGATTAYTVSSNGSFTLPQDVVQGTGYSVAVAKQPAGEVCTVSNGSGSSISSNVTNVTVSCSASASTYAIGGQVSGLAASASVVLLDNGGDPLTLNANGNFSFPTKVAAGSGYAVTVGSQPTGQTCSVSNASGAGVNADVTNVSVVCANTATSSYSIGGTVSGLPSGQQVSLVDNGDSANALPVTANGSFTFPTKVSGAYAVTVGSQPSGATCSVIQGSGTATANVTNVSVSCSTTSYTIGGTVSGLTSGQTATLELNGNTANTVSLSSTSTSFTFSTGVPAGQSYAVTVATQPSGETCTVSNGSGTANADVSNVSVSCAANLVQPAIFSSGFQTSTLTPEGGGYGGYAGAGTGNVAAAGYTQGGGGAFVTGTASSPASSNFYYYGQYPTSDATPGYEYLGVYVQAPGVTAISSNSDTAGLTLNGQNYLNFTLKENPEWANATSDNFAIILTLGKYYSATNCNVKLEDVVQPTSPTSAAAATPYKVALSDFTVAQNCGDTSLTSASVALASQSIAQIDFQGDGGTAALTQGTNGLTSSANLNVPSTQYPDVPTTIDLTGGINFTVN